MAGMSKPTRYGAGILMTIIAVGLALIMTYAMLSDPNFGGIIGTAAVLVCDSESLSWILAVLFPY